jgi:hydroxymethylglutaryl-CoA lyase
MQDSPAYQPAFPSSVEIVEVGLRDGLQNEATWVPTETKLDFIRQLGAAGLRRIQVTSFVHPRFVPQMRDAEELCASLPRRSEVQYSGLVLNRKGLERLIAAGLDTADMSVSASETHSRKNVNRSIGEALNEFAEQVELAQLADIKVRAGIQCAFGCVYEGTVPASRVLDIVRYYLDLGVDELALADSTGMGNPVQVGALVHSVRSLAGDLPIVLHLHDTRGLGLANLYAALQAGATCFDTAFGGLGGCPFIKGAAGNIATEDTLYLLEQLGIQTGVDRLQVAKVSRSLDSLLGRLLPGKLYRAEMYQQINV